MRRLLTQNLRQCVNSRGRHLAILLRRSATNSNRADHLPVGYEGYAAFVGDRVGEFQYVVATRCHLVLKNFGRPFELER